MSAESAAGSSQARRRVHRVGVALVFLTGLVAVINGLWFILSDQPFDSEGFSEELNMTREEARQASPQMESWVRHVQNQVGSVTTGWGLFVALSAITGLYRGRREVYAIVWVGALPTLIYSSFHEFLEFGTIDQGTLISFFAFLVFILGMVLVHAGEPARGKDEEGDLKRPLTGD